VRFARGIDVPAIAVVGREIGWLRSVVLQELLYSSSLGRFVQVSFVGRLLKGRSCLYRWLCEWWRGSVEPATTSYGYGIAGYGRFGYGGLLSLHLIGSRRCAVLV
jgi:hypothetical protein